jgi:hypothetical protein
MEILSIFVILGPLAFPLVAFAQVTSVQTFGTALIGFVNGTLLPFLFSVALLIFIYHVIRYFIVNPDNEKERESARRYAIYSILAFVLMTSVWGVVNLIVGGTGLGQSEPICPDSVPAFFCDSWGR